MAKYMRPNGLTSGRSHFGRPSMSEGMGISENVLYLCFGWRSSISRMCPALTAAHRTCKSGEVAYQLLDELSRARVTAAAAPHLTERAVCADQQVKAQRLIT